MSGENSYWMVVQSTHSQCDDTKCENRWTRNMCVHSSAMFEIIYQGSTLSVAKAVRTRRINDGWQHLGLVELPQAIIASLPDVIEPDLAAELVAAEATMLAAGDRMKAIEAEMLAPNPAPAKKRRRKK